MKNYYKSADSMNIGHSAIGKTSARCQGDSGRSQKDGQSKGSLRDWDTRENSNNLDSTREGFSLKHAQGKSEYQPLC